MTRWLLVAVLVLAGCSDPDLVCNGGICWRVQPDAPIFLPDVLSLPNK